MAGPVDEEVEEEVDKLYGAELLPFGDALEAADDADAEDAA